MSSEQLASQEIKGVFDKMRAESLHAELQVSRAQHAACWSLTSPACPGEKAPADRRPRAWFAGGGRAGDDR